MKKILKWPPLLIDALPPYNIRQVVCRNVHPCIIGPVQVMGRNAISWEQKFEYDIRYVENISLATDFKIVLKTIRKVFARKDINIDNNTTMTLFSENFRQTDQSVSRPKV